MEIDDRTLDIYLEKLRKESPIGIQFFNEDCANVFLKKGLAKKEDVQNNNIYKLVITEHGRSFEGFCEQKRQLAREQFLDELQLRSTKSAEESAIAAANSAVSAKNANVISRWAIVVSIVSIIVSIVLFVLSKCV